MFIFDKNTKPYIIFESHQKYFESNLNSFTKEGLSMAYLRPKLVRIFYICLIIKSPRTLSNWCDTEMTVSKNTNRLLGGFDIAQSNIL